QGDGAGAHARRRGQSGAWALADNSPMRCRARDGMTSRRPGTAAPWPRGWLAAVFLFSLGSWPAWSAVEFTGLSRTTERAIRASLDLAGEPCQVADSRLRRQFRRADGQIRRA